MNRHPLPLMPRALDVLGKEYQVINEFPPNEDEEEEGNSGECTFSRCEIHVDPTEAEPNQRDTLLHEVIHAVENDMDLGMKERQVLLLATGLLQVLRSNPHLVAYLMVPESIFTAE